MKSPIKHCVFNITPVIKLIHSSLTSTTRNVHSLFEVFTIQTFTTFYCYCIFGIFFFWLRVFLRKIKKGEKYKRKS